ncbi:hypothetical protein CYMTET_11299 [Cymbomonas tetramitiformis]|uniref:Uncharacterized protein n=1 Tax=Cymbomonas tetramitiformis TaxID=36881 RepID=A0AAE0GML1_9CHLO|nr:hypothetical protein CYMTET_11299 [Cymbomonas tetramitiformis]
MSKLDKCDTVTTTRLLAQTIDFHRQLLDDHNLLNSFFESRKTIIEAFKGAASTVEEQAGDTTADTTCASGIDAAGAASTVEEQAENTTADTTCASGSDAAAPSHHTLRQGVHTTAPAVPPPRSRSKGREHGVDTTCAAGSDAAGAASTVEEQAENTTVDTTCASGIDAAGTASLDPAQDDALIEALTSLTDEDDNEDASVDRDLSANSGSMRSKLDSRP